MLDATGRVPASRQFEAAANRLVQVDANPFSVRSLLLPHMNESAHG
jgi:hypothetical protein